MEAQKDAEAGTVSPSSSNADEADRDDVIKNPVHESYSSYRVDDFKDDKHDMEYFGVTNQRSSESGTSPLRGKGNSLFTAAATLKEPAFTLFRIVNHIEQAVGLILLVSYFAKFPAQCCGHQAPMSTTAEVI
jgi:hypothetical protein